MSSNNFIQFSTVPVCSPFFTFAVILILNRLWVFFTYFVFFSRFKLKAHNENGASTYSTDVSYTTKPGRPGPPPKPQVSCTHIQGVTKRCRLSWLTNSALVYKPKCGWEGVAGSRPMSTAVHMEWSLNKLWRSNSIGILSMLTGYPASPLLHLWFSFSMSVVRVRRRVVNWWWNCVKITILSLEAISGR